MIKTYEWKKLYNYYKIIIVKSILEKEKRKY